MSLSPFAYLVEALDLLGRAHTLHTRVVEASDGREIEARKDMTITLTSAAKRWFANLGIRDGDQTALSLMIVGLPSCAQDSADILTSKGSTMRKLATMSVPADSQDPAQIERLLRLSRIIERSSSGTICQHLHDVCESCRITDIDCEELGLHKQ